MESDDQWTEEMKRHDTRPVVTPDKFVSIAEERFKGCHEKRYGVEYFRQHFADIKYRRLYPVDKT